MQPGKVPFNDLSRLYQRHQQSLEDALLAATRSGWWLNGARGRDFAESFKTFIGTTECLLVANGTDALELSLRALAAAGETSRNEVITAPNAGGYTTTACRQVGLTPVYVDIAEGSQLIDIDAVLGAISDKTLAVVVTHLYGGAADVQRLRNMLEAAGAGNVKIVEDCAQAHGAHIDGRPVGSLGDIATFSFYPTKNLGALGDGGAVVTSDPELADLVRRLQQYGWRSKYEIASPGGRNSRMDELQAAALDVLLRFLPQTNAERRHILDRFRAAAPHLQFVDGGPGSVAHLAVLLSDRRDELRNFLLQRGIASDIHYPILDHDQPGWAGLPRRIAGDLAVSKRSAERLLSLPCFPGMTEEEIDLICTTLRDWTETPPPTR